MACSSISSSESELTIWRCARRIRRNGCWDAGVAATASIHSSDTPSIAAAARSSRLEKIL